MRSSQRGSPRSATGSRCTACSAAGSGDRVPWARSGRAGASALADPALEERQTVDRSLAVVDGEVLFGADLAGTLGREALDREHAGRGGGAAGVREARGRGAAAGPGAAGA